MFRLLPCLLACKMRGQTLLASCRSCLGLQNDTATLAAAAAGASAAHTLFLLHPCPLPLVLGRGLFLCKSSSKLMRCCSVSVVSVCMRTHASSPLTERGTVKEEEFREFARIFQFAVLIICSQRDGALAFPESSYLRTQQSLSAWSAEWLIFYHAFAHDLSASSNMELTPLEYVGPGSQ